MVTTVTEPFTVAAVGYNPELFELARNIAGACAMIEEAASKGAKVIVLPELATTGCNYPGLAPWLPYMDTIPGKTTAAIEPIARAHGCYVAIGIAELDPGTGMTYNSGALIGPSGYVGKYRKTGTNMADVPAFRPGNAGYPVFPTEYGNLALFICFDDTFWEPGRVASLKGADIICHMVSSARGITTGAQQASTDAVNHSTIAAAQEWCAWNGTALISANPDNSESNPTTGMTYWFGGSQAIWAPDGTLLARAESTSPDVSAVNEATIIYATIDPALYDNAQRRTFADRRPELYGDLSFFRVPIDLTANVTPHQVSVGGSYPGADTSPLTAMFVEMLITFGLVSVVMGTASGAQSVGTFAALGVGGYIALTAMWAGPLSGASMDPARTLGPNIVGGELGPIWVYIAGPLLGAALALVLAYLLRGHGGRLAASQVAQGALGGDAAQSTGAPSEK